MSEKPSWMDEIFSAKKQPKYSKLQLFECTDGQKKKKGTPLFISIYANSRRVMKLAPIIMHYCSI